MPAIPCNGNTLSRVCRELIISLHMPRWSAQRIAQIAIGILLLILVRSLAEFFRLKHFYGESDALARFEPFIGGCLIAAVCIGIAFALYVAARYKSAIVVCVVTVIGLLIYKISIVVP